MTDRVASNYQEQQAAKRGLSVLRTITGHIRYSLLKQKYQDRCYLCSNDMELRTLYQSFQLVRNTAPYDGVAATHDMLVLNRHADYPSQAEWQELLGLLDDYQYQYDSVQFNFPKSQSQKHHFHVHLLKWRVYP